MKYLLLLALSCSPVVTNQSIPAVDTPVVSVPSKPLFSTATPVKEVVPLFSTGAREETQSEVVRYLVRDRIRIDTVVCVDTVTRPCTLYVETTKTKIVFNNWMQYVMGFIGFVCGIVLMLLIELYKINKSIKKTEKRFM